ncbi:MAG: sensor histidine kinase [Rufibacter sp.]
MNLQVLFLFVQMQAPQGVSVKGSEWEWMYWAGELMAVVAYLTVAPILFYLTLKRDDLERRLVLFLFGLLAFLGAAVHVINLWGNREFMMPLLLAKLIFGIAALVTAFLLFRAIPGLLAIPSQRKLKQANLELREQIEERTKAEAALREAQEDLEHRVRERSSQLYAANRDLEREIETRKRTEKQLISKNYELVRINADLDDFVYYASRDLKGPLLNVAGLVQAIREELPPGQSQLNDLFSHLDASITQMDRKLNNLAEVSRIQRPVEYEDLDQVSLAEVLGKVQNDLHGAITSSKVEVVADFSQAPSVFITKENLYSLLYHLVSNAIKFRDPERPVKVEITSDLQDRYVRVTVQDNGIGLDLERHGPQLFSLFRRFHDHVEGSGMGLYIIKRIMDNNRGKVEVQSTLGKGTTFFLYFVNPLKDTVTQA